MKAISEKTYGRSSEYRMLHLWVEKQLGKPQHCVECGTTEKRRYAWANISQKYLKDVKDWRRLCYPCHMKEKRTKFCQRGHLRADYSYVRKSGCVDCLLCKRMANKEHMRRKRAGLVGVAE